MLKNIIIFIYSNFSTLFENIFYKLDHVSINDNNLLNEGFKEYKTRLPFELDTEKLEFIKINPYYTKIKLSRAQIKFIINKIFKDNHIAEILQKETGFKYFITHITAYQTEHIPENLSDKLAKISK